MTTHRYIQQRTPALVRRLLPGHPALVLSLLLLLCGAPQPQYALSVGLAQAETRTDAAIGDQEIMEAVQERLVEDPVSRRYDDLAVAVRNGTVYLNGTVESYYAKRRIGDIVGGISGVAAVENDLTVAERGDRQSDPAIRQAIEEGLVRDWLVSVYQITVDVDNGVATLSGTVDSRLEVLKAVENAFAGGARLVINRLEVKDAFNQYPEYITRDLFNDIRSGG